MANQGRITIVQGGYAALIGSAITPAGATVDVSGASGGGIVRIGGDRQGTGTLAHADTLTVDAASIIRADATGAGNGGNVTLWSDAATRFAGSISASGGAQGGDGGEAEVSSKGLLSFAGTADLTGTTFGTLLLDPYNVTSTGSDNQSGLAATGNDSVINSTSLATSFATANVTVSTGSAGAQAGNITLATARRWRGTVARR